MYQLDTLPTHILCYVPVSSGQWGGVDGFGGGACAQLQGFVGKQPLVLLCLIPLACLPCCLHGLFFSCRPSGVFLPFSLSQALHTQVYFSSESLHCFPLF